MPCDLTAKLRSGILAVVVGGIWLHSPVLTAQSEADGLAFLQQAKTYEAQADFANAAASYREYLLIPAPKSAQRRHARLKLPVLQEAVKYGADPGLPSYLNAMDLRAAGNSEQADAVLAELIENYAGGAMTDDALYMRAYIALMDHYDYQGANVLLKKLRYEHPDSRYFDTALFSEAIVHEQLGNTEQAIETMSVLKDRHTGMSVGGISWARDEYTSRLWYERSTARIEHLEERAKTATQFISMTEYNTDGYQWLVELSVAQQNMTLLLNESDAINEVMVTGPDAKELNAFSGIVMGQPESWARITMDGESVRGMISVYGERHVLTPAVSGGSLSDFHTLLLGDIDGNVTENLHLALVPPKSDDSLNNYLRSIKQASEAQLTPGTVSQVAMIGVVIDSKYNAYHNGDGLNEALSILNTTDGVFREQLGIALKVATVVVIDNAANDPMNLGSVSMEDMMRNFKDYRFENLGSDIGLATLFSGNKNSDAALGLAWIGAACRTDGYDVSVVTPYKMPALLSTHEIGHSLGAKHDDETDCRTQTGHIMWPFLSSASGRTFSSCSTQGISETMVNNNCHIDALDLSLTLGDIDASSLTVTVANEDIQRAAPDAVVTIEGPGVGSAAAPASCWQLGANSVQCGVGTLSPMEFSDISFSFPTALSDTAQITATVESSGFLDMVTDNNGFKTDIHGNNTAYSGPVNSDPVTMTAKVGTSQSTGAPTSSAGTGSLPLGGLFALFTLLATRRRLT